ncbi:MAG: MucB/RseB C-terminal domain-containing protein [Proteobacteria bacterium]|nr:MucB/RseB C-terminal domain-containing protein [Pseudomonadota bacterium]
MRQTPVSFQLSVVLIFSLTGLLTDAHAADALAGRREVQTWLNKTQSAARKLEYSGTFVYQQANLVRTSRITHVLEGRNEIEKLEVLDGKPREFIRRNEEIVTYVPEARTLLVEKRLAADVFPSLLTSSTDTLEHYYSVKKTGGGRVAGHDCLTLTLEPKDTLRYGYKLWLDRRTGLLLRAQTLNDKREIVEQISFSQIEIGRIGHARVKPSFNNTHGWRVENAVTRQVESSAWSIKSIPPGFRKIREVKRLLSDPPSRNTTQKPADRHEPREVLQIVLSDGLAAISVFIEPVGMNRTEGYMQQGATNVVGKRQGDFWLTIVGEVPAAAVKQVANSIELKTK